MTTTRAHAPEPERRPTPPSRAVTPAQSAPAAVMRWQSTAGNAAVAGLLTRGGRPPSPAPVVARQEQEEDGEGGSWWSRAAGALRAAMRMKDLLGGVLGRGADVVGSIVRSPVAFLGNLVAGVKGGILRFRANIADHLKRGLMGWLLGALAEGGVQLPATFDAKGIVSMFASLFGLTWNAIRTRVVTRIGEGAMGAVEKGVEVFRLLSGQGIAGLWPMLLARLGNLQEMLLGQVRDFVISRVLTAGVTWLIGVLNPAAGIIKALKLIYDIVVFFRENAARLSKLVETVLDSVADVARGSVGTVVTKVESVLGGMVPTLIGFLASVLGLGGIGQRIRGIVESMQKPVRAAVDYVIGVGLRLAGPIIRRFGKVRDAVRAKVAAGRAWVEGKTFVIGEERHHLLADRRSGEVRMASSTPRPPDQALTDIVARVNLHRRRALLEPLSVKTILADVRPRIREMQRQITATGAASSESTKSKLNQLSEAMESLLAQIGGGARRPDPAVVGAGEIGLHSEMSGKYPRKSQPHEWLHLESEHVVPVALVSGLYAALGDSAKIERDTPEDLSQHTILVYKGAASKKTYENLSDAVGISWAKGILGKGAPNLSGRSRMALSHRGATREEQDERSRLWRGRSREEVLILLRDMLPDRMSERVEDLIAAIAADHRRWGKKRGDEAARPEPGAVRRAAQLQVADIIRIFGERLRS